MSPRRQPPAQPGDVDPTAMLTPHEVAALFGVDAKTLGRWARQGRIPATFTLGGHRRFRGEDVARCLAEGRARTTGCRSGAAAD